MTRNSAKHLAVSDFLCTFASEKNKKEKMDMTTAILNNGSCYSIPEYDVEFFRAIAKKMGWTATPMTVKKESKTSWVDQFAGKWQDSRSTEEIIEDIHKARTLNDEIVL